VTLVLPSDLGAVEAMHRAAGEPDADPVWAEVWPSAFAAADALLSEPGVVAGRRVCELGAGVGLAGLAASLAGAVSVLLSDREPRALQCALAAAAASQAAGVSTCVLDWDAPELPAELRGCCDVLLLADVLYQPGSIASLARVTTHLLAPAGVIFLADTARRPGKEGLREAFLSSLLQSTGRRMSVRSQRTVVARMPAPAQDVNTGDAHPVELIWLADSTST
jgi:predicted nicotinamide N-methyase